MIVAEVGSNHCGDLNRALALIDRAADCGVDAVKFQVWRADDLYVPGSELAEKARPWELDRRWLPTLAQRARSHRLSFVCSVFDREAADLCAPLCDGLKIAALEIGETTLVQYVAGKDKPMILSVNPDAEPWAAIQACLSAHNNQITLLHCVSDYPTSIQEARLERIVELRWRYSLAVGISDHSTGVDVPRAAALLGVEMVEKHFTDTLNGYEMPPDHPFASFPAEMTSLVSFCRALNCRPTPVERPEESRLARRVAAARIIRRGEVITADSLTTRRGRVGVCGMGAVVGRKAGRDIGQWEFITPGEVVTGEVVSGEDSRP